MTADPTAPTGPEVLLHEERLQVTATREPVERVLLRRVITTTTRQVEVTVRREELVIERRPADDRTSADGAAPAAAAPATATAAIPEPLVILLSEEVPVVTVVTRPYERITVHLDTVTDREQIGASLSHEEVEVRTTPTDVGGTDG